MTTEEHLLESCGPLMTMGQLAKLLDRSPEGLRIGLRQNSSWATKVNAARLKIGRRVYYRTTDIAKLIDAPSA